MVSAGSHSLLFDPSICSAPITETWYGKEVTYRACENIVYVSNPVDTNYQKMNIYIPETYYEGGFINGYTAKTAPIFFPMTVGGYFSGPPATVATESVRYALLNGYVVAAPGARGHDIKNADGLWTGKAPACIVDVKAAVRYLRHNDKRMPGDAEKIITNGTSASGALSSLLGATGNNKDYEPYLKAIGAAEARDDIFAASCYCPIQNLDNADTAMEWQFNNIYFVGPPTFPTTEEQDVISDDLKAMFPAYLNSLRLRVPDHRSCNNKHHKKGTVLTLDEDGEGNFKDYVKSFVIASAQKFMEESGIIPEFDWITREGTIVTDIDFYGFSAEPTYPGRLPFKLPPAFDALGLGSFENQLFGTATIAQQHFTQYGYANSTAGATLADPKIVKMMNPTYYIGKKGSTIAQYWRIRHGTIDHHTSLAIPVILATMLENNGYDVDFALPWERDHGGDYDLFALFAWIDRIADPGRDCGGHHKHCGDHHD